MLIDDENIRVQYDSTAESPIVAGDALPFPFRFIEKEQVKAMLLDGTKLVFNEDYTVGLEEEEEEKPEGEDEASVSSDYTSVILNIDIPVGETITLYRETDLDQTSEFPQEARFSSRKIEDALDKLTMQNQEQREALGRAMKLPLTAAVDLKDLALPNPEPNKSVKWNSDGTALVNTSFDPDTALVTTENFKKQAEQSAKDSANSAAASANSATVAGQKVNEITALHSDYMDDINTTSTNYLNQINSRGNTIIKDADAIINRVGLNMFDPVIKDHKLTYPDGQGLALQGTWVYRDAKAGERYGYPDFYNTCVKEFKESTAAENNVTVTGTITNDKGVISGFSDDTFATIDSALNYSGSSFEIKLKFTTGSEITTNQTILSTPTTAILGSSPGYGVAINIANSAMSLYLSSDANSSWDICSARKGKTTLTQNTTYWCRLVFNTSSYRLYLSTNGTSWVEDITINSTATAFLNNNYLALGIFASNIYFRGSIDLNECYIDINGARWWDGVRLRRHANQHFYYPISAKATFDARFESNGAAWYYGVDEANKRIFLPRNNWFMQMASSGAGNFTNAGIPDHTHTVSAFYWTSSGSSAEEGRGKPDYGRNETRTTSKASASNSVYGKSSTVQPKSIKHLLYICVGNQVQTDSWVDTITQVKNGAKEIDDSVQGAIADVEEAKDECIAEIGTKTAELTSKMAFSMFDTVLKDHKLSYPYDQGFALQGTYVYHDADPGIRYGYPDFYNMCVKECAEARDKGGVQQITLGDTTINMYIHDNGHMYYNISIKDSIDTWFNTFGTAWFYGVDYENKRIFLPRNNWFEQGTSVVGDIGKSVDAGVPNITGTFAGGSGENTGTGYYYSNTSVSGAFTKTQITKGRVANSTSGSYPKARIDFNASRSSAVYGKSSTVQPKAVKKLLYICVGNRLQDTSWIDVATQVANGVKTIDDVYQRDLDSLNNTYQTNLNNINSTSTTNLNNINTAYNQAMKTLQAVGPVLQTGSTMTGQLKFKTTSIDTAVTPSAAKHCFSDYVDPNDIRIGVIGAIQNTNGMFGTYMQAGNIGQCRLVTDGTDAYFDFPKCTTRATTTSSARSDKVAVVVQNYINGTSWYRVWSDGWIEQGGRAAASNGGTKTKFLKTYSVMCNVVTNRYGGHTGHGKAEFYVNWSTTEMTAFEYDGCNFGWYACGY